MKSVIKWEAALAEASKDLPEKPEAQAAAVGCRLERSVRRLGG